MMRLSIADISRMLAERIEALAPVLFPAGKRDGAEWKIGSIAGEPGRSMSICLRGTKAGIWSDFAGGLAGDAFELVAHTLYNGDRRQAVQWSMRWLGLAPGTEAPHAARQGGRQNEQSAIIQSSVVAASRLWTEARSAKGTIVEIYLKTRGLRLPDADCIRFHPACPHGAGQHHRVMLALMTDPVTSRPTGILRTPLSPDGNGRPAGVDKKMMGSAGVVRLADDADVTIGLGLAEGIETALSIMQHANWAPVWAACTAGGIDRFPVLPGVESLTIFADHDIAGVNAAQNCARRWALADRDARIVAPRQHGDWNDVVREAVV